VNILQGEPPIGAFPECRLQHLKTVALDIFVGWEAPVERLGLPSGAWFMLLATRVKLVHKSKCGALRQVSLGSLPREVDAR